MAFCFSKGEDVSAMTDDDDDIDPRRADVPEPERDPVSADDVEHSSKEKEDEEAGYGHGV